MVGNTGKYAAVDSNNFMEMWKEFIHRTCFYDIGISVYLTLLYLNQRFKTAKTVAGQTFGLSDLLQRQKIS
jgi:hypothetical protein